MKKQGLTKYTTKFINQNFRIKVYGRDEQGKKINTLMGDRRRVVLQVRAACIGLYVR